MLSTAQITLSLSLLFTAVTAAPIAAHKRQLFDAIGDFIGDVQSGVGDFVEGVGEKAGFFEEGTNFTPTQSISVLGADIINELERTAHFSNAAYCTAGSVRDWSCGKSCDFLGPIEVLFAGGDNQDSPAFFVAFDPSEDTVVLTTQGTEATEIESIIIDLQLIQDPLDAANFPNAPPGTLVHSGFQKAFDLTAQNIGTEVAKALAAKNTNKLLITGHSLGAALATMNAVFLKEQLGAEIEITTRVFGLPRVGNSVWANYVDDILGVGGQYLHMHTGKDIVPTIPPASLLDYTHPSGEIFDNLEAQDGTTAVLCPGQENQLCSAGNNFLEKSILDHIGPFAGVDIGIFDCVV